MKRVEKKIARTTFKTGYIYQEIILRPVDEVKVLLNDLKGAGFELGIGKQVVLILRLLCHLKI